MAQVQELSGTSCFNVMSFAAFVILLVTPCIGHLGRRGEKGVPLVNNISRV